MSLQPALPSLYGETLESLAESLATIGHPPWRAKQVLRWLYQRRITDWAGMTDLPQGLRDTLAERFTFLPSSRVFASQSSDITEKMLLRQEDGALIETVLIRYPQNGVGEEGSRRTVCISTQVGCAYGCRFCASGLEGWKRNLSTAEIVAQLIHVCLLEEKGKPDHQAGAPFDNIVVMGMGEPLANYDNLVRAIRILNADWGLRFGARRITVSTSGLVPQILRLADEPIQFRLAISLHGATNEVRERIMPINRKYPLEKLIPAAQVFARKHGRMLTLEYILIHEVNDSLEQARSLATIAQQLHAHVNCIPYNTVEGLPWQRPSLPRQRAFCAILRQAGVSHTIRKEKGHEIDAACGQLRLRKERELNTSAT